MNNYKLKFSQCIDYLKKDNKLTFFAHVVQLLNVRYCQDIPTMGVYFDNKTNQYYIKINTNFLNELPTEQASAVILHEIFHVSHKHVLYDLKSNKYDFKILNVSMDLVINQLIENLPDFAMFIKDFRDKNGKLFEENRTTEYYYNLLLNDAEVNTPKPGNELKDDKGFGNENWQNAKDYFKSQEQQFDEHGWNEENDTATEKEKLEALNDLFKRAIQKVSYSHTTIPQNIQDLLEEIKIKLKNINYKEILLNTLKKSVQAKDTEKTWRRPSRRYGLEAKGNISAKLPSIHVLGDTSGSISYNEFNEFLEVIRNFLTIGVSKAKLHLFHTELYHSETIKKGFKLSKEKFQSGGTDLTDAFQKISKERCDLLIVLTDGYYDLPAIDKKLLPQTVFVIPENCNKDHPTKDFGKTVLYKKVG